MCSTRHLAVNVLLPEGRLPEHVVPLLDPEQARGGQAGGIGACRFEIRKFSKIITLQMFCVPESDLSSEKLEQLCYV